VLILAMDGNISCFFASLRDGSIGDAVLSTNAQLEVYAVVAFL